MYGHLSKTPSLVVDRFLQDNVSETEGKEFVSSREIKTEIEGCVVRLHFNVLDSLFVNSHTLPFGIYVDAVLVVYDVTDQEEFQRVDHLLGDVLTHTVKRDVKRYLVGNKCYVSEDERKVSFEQGAAIAAEHGVPYYEVSSRTGEGINEMFRDIATILFTEYRNEHPECFKNENDSGKEEEGKEDKKDCVIC